MQAMEYINIEQQQYNNIKEDKTIKASRNMIKYFF